MTLQKSRQSESESTLAKATLFCSTCDHASPADGDWFADDGSPGRRLLCPRCGAVVVDDNAI